MNHCIDWSFNPGFFILILLEVLKLEVFSYFNAVLLHLFSVWCLITLTFCMCQHHESWSWPILDQGEHLECKTMQRHLSWTVPFFFFFSFWCFFFFLQTQHRAPKIPSERICILANHQPAPAHIPPHVKLKNQRCLLGTISVISGEETLCVLVFVCTCSGGGWCDWEAAVEDCVCSYMHRYIGASVCTFPYVRDWIGSNSEVLILLQGSDVILLPVHHVCTSVCVSLLKCTLCGDTCAHIHIHPHVHTVPSRSALNLFSGAFFFFLQEYAKRAFSALCIENLHGSHCYAAFYKQLDVNIWFI